MTRDRRKEMADTDMRIRKAKAEDAQGILHCVIKVWESLREVLPEPWVEDEIERDQQPEAKVRLQKTIADPIRISLVAEEDGEIVGIALGRTDKSALSWLGFIGVSPTHRRRGIGRELLQRYLDESKLKGAKKVSLNTAPQLKPAVNLYVDTGFVPEGYLRRHRYGVDLIIYSKFI